MEGGQEFEKSESFGKGEGIYLDIGDGPGTIGSVDVSDHLHTSVLELAHVAVVGRVGGGGGTAVRVDNGDGSDLAGSCCHCVPRSAWVDVEGDQQLEGLLGGGHN